MTVKNELEGRVLGRILSTEQTSQVAGGHHGTGTAPGSGDEPTITLPIADAQGTGVSWDDDYHNEK